CPDPGSGAPRAERAVVARRQRAARGPHRGRAGGARPPRRPHRRGPPARVSSRWVGVSAEPHRGAFEAARAARGVTFSGVETKGALRTCLALRDQQGARVTEILEPGPEVDTTTRAELCARFLPLARESTLAVLSGSLPPGF